MASRITLDGGASTVLIIRLAVAIEIVGLPSLF
jgi:hypothetical protein